MELDALHHRARELGVETFYWDDQGTRHEANPEALTRVVEILDADYSRNAGRRLHPIFVGAPGTLPVGDGVSDASLQLGDGTELDLPVVDGHVTIGGPLPIGAHTLSLGGPALDERSTIVIAPDRMPRDATLRGTAGVFAPAYALWERQSPLPSFGHLAALGQALPALGADVLVTLPLYAGFFDEPFDPSPYAPVSRLHWNELYLDDDGLPTAPIPEFGELIDWRALARRRRDQLLRLAATADSELSGRVERWLVNRPDVAGYARFRASVKPDPTDAGHPVALIEASHHIAQYLADLQLSRVEGSHSAVLALDLPIGSHPSGYETWAHPELFAPAMAVGAPPDALFTSGQNWGFPPQLPGAAERSGFALWRRLIASCGSYSSILRIDHVLGLHRLWWIPDGMSSGDGVYVRYPRDSLTAAIAAEAVTSGTTLVGENLGTVPQEIFDLLDRWSLLGLHAERLFIAPSRLAELGGLPAVPAGTVACLRTHDMEPWAALYAAGELDAYRAAIADDLGRAVPDTFDDLLDAAHRRLAESDAYVVIADLDDLLGETTPHNVPGKVLPTIWRRRLTQPTSETLADPVVRARLGTLTRRAEVREVTA
jgi:4-alpha-glucanotransferase